MHNGVQKFALVISLIVASVVLVLDVLYFVRGSLETFPTPEQQEKIRIVTGVIAIHLGILVAVLWGMLKRLNRGR